MDRKTLIGGTIINGTTTTRIRTGGKVIVVVQAADVAIADSPKR